MVNLVEFFCGLVALLVSENKWLISFDANTLRSFSCYPKLHITDNSIKLVLNCWYDNCLYSMPWNIIFSSKHSTLYPDVVNIYHDCNQKTISLKHKHTVPYRAIANASNDVVNRVCHMQDINKFTDYLFDIAGKKYEEIGKDEGYRKIINSVL